MFWVECEKSEMKEGAGGEYGFVCHKSSEGKKKDGDFGKWIYGAKPQPNQKAQQGFIYPHTC